jgi:hypothetical protein
MSLVVEHELRHGAAAGGDPAAETLSFKVGPVFAQCAKCGAQEFGRADTGAALTYKSMLACRGCGAKTVHGELIVQLAREVSVHARSSLARAKARTLRRGGGRSQSTGRVHGEES